MAYDGDKHNKIYNMNKLAKAVFTLTTFSVLDRILGFLFKIYLSREMGASALGVYQVALSFFFVLMTLTTSGLPLIGGKMTAALDAKGQPHRTHSLTSAALLLNCIIAVALVGLVLSLKIPLSAIISSEESMSLLFVLLPGLLFCSVAAAFRGSFWGKERFTAISVIELLEQIVRILLCVVLFTLGLGKTFAAALSLTIAMGFSALLTALMYFAKGGKLSPIKGELKPLFASSAPISVLRASSSLVNSLLAVAVPFLYASTGMTTDEALAMFGATVGMAMPLMFLPITVIGSLSQALIPSLSKADAAGDKAEVRRLAERAIKFSIIVAALFIPLFAGVGYESGVLLYDNADAGKFLCMGGLLLIPIAIESITSSMMNSLGMEKQGFANYVIGSVVMFGIMFCFYGRFSAEVFALAWFASLTLSTALDVICIKKHTGISLGFVKTILLCLALAVPCAFITSQLANLLAFLSAPLLVIVAVSGIIGSAGILALMMGFGFMDNFVLIGRKKKRGKTISEKKNAKERKRLHINA